MNIRYMELTNHNPRVNKDLWVEVGMRLFLNHLTNYHLTKIYQFISPNQATIPGHFEGYIYE